MARIAREHPQCAPPLFRDNTFGYASRRPCDTATFVSAPCSYAVSYLGYGAIEFIYRSGTPDVSPYSSLDYDLNTGGQALSDFGITIATSSDDWINEITLGPSVSPQTTVPAGMAKGATCGPPSEATGWRRVAARTRQRSRYYESNLWHTDTSSEPAEAHEGGNSGWNPTTSPGPCHEPRACCPPSRPALPGTSGAAHPPPAKDRPSQTDYQT